MQQAVARQSEQQRLHAQHESIQIYTPKKDTVGTRAVPGAPWNWKVTKSVSHSLNAPLDLNMLELGTTQRRLSDLYHSM